MWHCHPNQFYAVEVTLPSTTTTPGHVIPESPTLSLLELLPDVTCLNPCEVLDQLDAESEGVL